jgi:hypothetical protein
MKKGRMDEDNCSEDTDGKDTYYKQQAQAETPKITT